MTSMFHEAGAFKRELCGAAWLGSKAIKKKMFQGSSGSIPQTVCTSAPPIDATTIVARQDVSRRPIPERELILRTSITRPVSTPATTSTIANTRPCAKCGTFLKSGRVSCCAPDGAWNNNCGRAGNKNVGHSWFEGVEACKGTFQLNGYVCMPVALTDSSDSVCSS